MATTSSERAETLGSSCAVSAAFLPRFRDAHSRLLEAMDALDEITRRPAADRPLYTSARWRISAASLSRRTLWKEIYGHLQPLVDAHGAETLEELNTADLDLLHHSAIHVARWTSDAVEREWPAYCSSSRLIRARMMAAITGEKRFLYPLLARYEPASGRGLTATTPAAASDERTNRWSRSAAR
jgi:hypothetical protein